MFCDGTCPAQRPQLEAPVFISTLSPSRDASKCQVTINIDYDRSLPAHQRTAGDSDIATSLTVTTAQGVQVAVQTPPVVEGKTDPTLSVAVAGGSLLANTSSTPKVVSPLNHEPISAAAPLEDDSVSKTTEETSCTPGITQLELGLVLGHGSTSSDELGSSGRWGSTGPAANTETSIAPTSGLREEGGSDDVMGISK
ncbi:hypothetical protein BC629DRAFT_1591513 [Irpex lacteus]|nr:hypothetical protein BC629DRAFT_1591513 [Irpex lacteus]